MNLKLSIYFIFLAAMFICPTKHYAATKTTPLPLYTTIITKDTILIDEEEAELAFANAKDFYDNMANSLTPFVTRGIGRLRRNYKRFLDAEEDLDLALTFYTAVKDVEKIELLRKMSNKSTTYIILSLLFTLSKLASIYSLILIIGIGSSSFAVALFALPLFLLLETLLFGMKKMFKTENK